MLEMWTAIVKLPPSGGRGVPRASKNATVPLPLSRCLFPDCSLVLTGLGLIFRCLCEGKGPWRYILLCFC